MIRVSSGCGIAARVLTSATGTIAASIGAAVVVVGVLVAVIGHNPFEVYAAMLEGSLTGRGLVTTLQRAIPLVGLTLALVLSFRAGVFNLGGEGQFVGGALAGTVTALALPEGGVVSILLACAAGCVVGAAIAVVPGVIEVRLGPPVLITSLLLNYVVLAGVSWAIALLKSPAASEQSTPTVSEDVRIGAVIPADSPAGAALAEALGAAHPLVLLTRGLNWSVVVVSALVVATVLFARRTALGFEAGVVGLNAAFARAVGIRAGRVVVSSLSLGGAVAGLVGVLLILGTNYRLIDGELSSTGFATTAILVVLLGRSAPLSSTAAALFFSVLDVGGEQLNREFGLSPAIAQIIQALIIFFVVLRLSIPLLTRWVRERAERTVGASQEATG